jgi:hypothetical protein
MKIKGYLFTGIAKQLNHTYYSLGEHLYARFYHNLEDGLNKESFEWSLFVYEVELDSEDVYTITYYYLEATKFKLVRIVEFSEIVKVLDLSSRTRNELNAILNGTADRNKIIQQYKKLLTKDYSDLSRVEFYKFIAIVSQKHYKLSLIGFSSYGTFRYIRVLEFYNQPHRYALAGEGHSFVVYNKEKFYGSRIFESLSNCTINDLLREYDIRVLLQTRKLSQKKFEEYCEYKLKNKDKIYNADECVGAGYKILPKYKEQFYPYIIYSNPELALDLVPNDVTVRSYTSLLLLKAGYKIKGLDYSIDRDCVLVQEAKKIFMKNDYKYI